MTVTLLVSTACLLQTVFFTGLALFIFRRKLLIGSNLFTFLSLSLAVYSLGAAMQPLLHNLAWMLFWNNFIYLGMVWIGPLWLLLALEYSGFDTGTKPGIVVALSLIPLATLILKYHPETSRLIYPEVGINENDLIWVIYFTRGPWYWVHVTHTILSVLVGDILIIKVFFQATPGFRRQGSCMLAASAIPFLSLLLYIPGNLLHGMDLIPLGFTITAVFLALGLFRYDLFNNKPVSWESIVQAAGTGIIVLDGNSNLVEMNTAAAKLFPQNRRGSLGLSIHDIPGLEKLDLDKGADRRDFRLEKEKEKISGTAEVSLIHDGSGRVISRTILLHFQQASRATGEKYYSPPERERDWKKLAVEMEKNRWYLDPELTLPSLAKKTGLPRNRLSYLLNEDQGQNFNDYINTLRIEEALRLLEDPRRSVLETCFEAGFNSKATFYTAFRRLKGMSPGEYRERQLSQKKV